MDSNNSRPVDPQVRIGHVHLKAADSERALRFYCGALGFEIAQRYSTQAADGSAGGYHHIGLNAVLNEVEAVTDAPKVGEGPVPL